MKKYLILLIAPVMFSCGSEDCFAIESGICFKNHEPNSIIMQEMVKLINKKVTEHRGININLERMARHKGLIVYTSNKSQGDRKGLYSYYERKIEIFEISSYTKKKFFCAYYYGILAHEILHFIAFEKENTKGHPVDYFMKNIEEDKDLRGSIEFYTSWKTNELCYKWWNKEQVEQHLPQN